MVTNKPNGFTQIETGEERFTRVHKLESLMPYDEIECFRSYIKPTELRIKLANILGGFRGDMFVH
jgi:hypothetical protein